MSSSYVGYLEGETEAGTQEGVTYFLTGEREDKAGVGPDLSEAVALGAMGKPVPRLVKGR